MKTADEIINDLRNGRRVEYRTISHVMMPPETHLAVLVDHAFAGEVIDCIEELKKQTDAHVKHGEWIPQDDTFTRYRCSICKAKNFSGHERYCPNCGGWMVGRSEETNRICPVNNAPCIECVPGAYCAKKAKEGV